MEDFSEASMAAQMAQARRDTAPFENIDIIVKWQKKLYEMNRDNQGLQAEVSILQHENYFLGIGLQEVKNENEVLKSKLEEAETTITTGGDKYISSDTNTLKLQLIKTEEKYKISKKQVAEWWAKFNNLATDYNHLVEDSNQLKRKYKQKKAQLKALIQAAQYMIANDNTVHQPSSSSEDVNLNSVNDYDQMHPERHGRRPQSRLFYSNGRSQEDRYSFSRRDIAPLQITKIAPLQVRKGKGKWDF